MGKKLCICQICVCGRHKCPHRPYAPAHANGPCVLTEYNNRYIEHPLAKPESYKPPPDVRFDTGPISDKTTFRTDYIPHPLSKPELHKVEEYVPAKGDFDFTTSYRKEYMPKPVFPSKSVRPSEAKRPAGRFEAEPTYKNDFRRWPLSRPERHVADTGWSPPEIPFQGQTTVQHDFIPHPLGNRMSFKPEEVAKLSDAPFQDATDYKQSYIKHPLPPREKKEKEEYAAPKAPLDGLTTFNRDYTAHPLEKVISYKPAPDVTGSSAPLDDRTNYATDFKAWPAEKPKIHEADKYVPPAGNMDLHTSYKVDYIPQPIRFEEARRPVSRTKRSTAKFEGNPTYRDDFRKWPMHGPVKQTVKADYSPPDAPFQGMSQYTSHYIPHPLHPPTLMKPNVEAAQSTGPFDGYTMYRQEYTPKRSEPCPAALLDTGASQFVNINEQDLKGHKFYRPAVATPLENKADRLPLVVT